MDTSQQTAAWQATLTPLAVSVLGPPQLSHAGLPLGLPRRQMRALFYRLAVNLQPVPREQLCFLLWPDIPDATARRQLTVLLNQLRQALPVSEMVLAQHHTIALDPLLTRVYTFVFATALAH